MSLESRLIPTRVTHNGKYYVHLGRPTSKAFGSWEPLAQLNPVEAAAATRGNDPFAKYPSWLGSIRLTGVLLDAGCGYGRISIPLLEQDPRLQVIGIDASDAMLTYFWELAAERALVERVILVKSDLSAIPVEHASVDSVVTAAVMLHNPYDVVEDIVAELFRCLRPGGQAVFAGSFPNLWTMAGVQNLVYSRLRPRRNGPVRPFRRDWIRRMMEQHADTVRIEANGLAVLPKHLAKVSPRRWHSFAAHLNASVARRPRIASWAKRSGLLVEMWDVVAIKKA